jgi:hypothetical protein
MSEGCLKIDDCGQWAERFVLEVAGRLCARASSSSDAAHIIQNPVFHLATLSVKENPRNPNNEK